MKFSNWRIILGIGLIGLGAVTLLQALGFLANGGLLLSLLVSGLFLAGGTAFISILLNDRSQWWPIIPSGVLIDLGLLILLSAILPASLNRFGGSFFLAGLGLVFLLVYMYTPQNWWSIIPGGVLITLAVVAGLDEFASLETGGILFIGMAATFALLGILPISGTKMTWPWIPAGILFTFGMLISLSSSQMAGYIWPAAMIIGGLFLIFRTFTKSQ